jgi:hypothetical protein
MRVERLEKKGEGKLGDPDPEEEGKNISVAGWVPNYLADDHGLNFLSAKEPEALRHRPPACLYLGLSLRRETVGT